jgi:hypothetical protein
MSVEFEALNFLRKVANVKEAYHLLTFKCYREAKDGHMQEVLVEVLDGGPEHFSARYRVIVSAEGKSASGNSFNSVEAAIATVHWGDLDK